MRKSWIWHHGKLFIGIENGKIQAHWSCNKYTEKKNSFSFAATSSTWIAKHLEDIHEITRVYNKPPIPPQMLRGDCSKTIEEMLKSKNCNLSKFRHDLTTWIAVSCQAFLVIEEPTFREMIASLSSKAESIIPKSANTVRSWVVNEFQKQKEALRERLQQARSRIHLSMDIWTTPSGNRAYLGIVAHWIDYDNEVREVLIALPDLKGNHSGSNIAATAFKVIKDYGIAAKVGFCMLDNATNNDSTIPEFRQLLMENYDEDTLFLSADDMYLRCFGHIMNIAAKALLFGSNPNSFEHSSPNRPDTKAEEEEFIKWRKAGPIGRAYNFVVFLYRSCQRCDAFRNIQTDILKMDHSIMPHMTNSTRWNSYFLMINDLLNLREAVDFYVGIYRSSKTMEKKDKKRLEDHCILEEDDWEELLHLHALLYDFWELTLRM